jgi:hypothetical protein
LAVFSGGARGSIGGKRNATRGILALAFLP